MSGTLEAAHAQLDAGEFSCAICIDLLVDPVVGTCGHDFCRVCYETWLAKATLCPLCRQQLSTTTPGPLLPAPFLVAPPVHAPVGTNRAGPRGAVLPRRRVQAAGQPDCPHLSRAACPAQARSPGVLSGLHCCPPRLPQP